VAEISEMLAAMTGTSNLDDLHGADACSAPEPEISRIAPLQALVRQAWANLHQGDRGTLLSWWGNPRRLAHPIGPLQQFHGRLKALMRGQTLSQVLQLSLAVAVPVVTPDPKPPRPRRNRKALEAAAGQLGLLVG
jgi:hypothetical protein